MEHLTLEVLAALVDEAPGPEEARHLGSCDMCRKELEALRRQTEELEALPELLPPPGDWDVLEARLRSEGLVHDPGLLARLSLAHTPPWMRAAAGLVLFVSGTGLGAALASGGHPDGSSPPDPAFFTRAVDVEEAASAVRVAEENYVSALSRYRQLLAERGEDGTDPRSRFAALEYLVAAGQAAVRQAPADQFLNGLLASTLAEREAVLRRISADGGNWF